MLIIQLLGLYNITMVQPTIELGSLSVVVKPYDLRILIGFVVSMSEDTSRMRIRRT